MIEAESEVGAEKPPFGVAPWRNNMKVMKVLSAPAGGAAVAAPVGGALASRRHPRTSPGWASSRARLGTVGG
jgi:hypothetical protein